jgi:hypothetical protein
MVTRPATFSGRARAASSAIQPPMEEPTSTTGPAIRSSTAQVSANQSPMQPSVKTPPLIPWPE